ncbi:hypothetical protein WJX75_001523 [Coccomyxa subellipsoidea]|uniref:Uncharacterized protein n=1 Tax=Coccomyxa subellipsoidea TaxID=248742 RepID=A0ABR2YM95_9CHLO
MPSEQLVVLVTSSARTILACTAVASSAWLFAAPCEAADREWLPRRHFRRIDDPRQRVLDGKHASKVSNALGEARNAASSFQKSVAKAFRSQPQQEFSMGLSAGPRPAPIPGYVRLMQSGLGWGALLAAGLALLWIVGRLPSFLSGLVRSKEGGKWVRDRSLGGKMVFVPDIPSTVPQRDSVGTAEDVDLLRGSASAHVATSASEQGTNGDEMPDWWNPTPALHVSLYYKQEAEKSARAILKEVEDAKLAGYDYPISSLIALRQVCGEAGVSVRPRTASGRDAMLRTGAEAAVDAAMQQSGAQLGGMPPSTFVTGLARDLEVPEDKAANIALAVIAAKARGALIDACAAYRENNSQEALYQLLRIAGLLEALPLPPRSPQADMVAASISQRATLQEREAIFMTYGRMEPSTADRVAEMLGFDPAMVLPQLHEALEKSAQ